MSDNLSIPTEQCAFKATDTREQTRSRVWLTFIGNTIEGKCFACGCIMHATENWEMGHVIPKSKGGPDDISNLRPIHRQCNRSMGVEHMDEFRKRIGLSSLSSEVTPQPIVKEIATTLSKKILPTPEPKSDSYFCVDESSIPKRLRLQTGIPIYDPEHPLPEQLEILKYLGRVYPNSGVLAYVLTAFASCMEGSYKQKKLFLFSGTGSNGRTTVLTLLFATFKGLSISLPSTILTGASVSVKDKKQLTQLNGTYVGNIISPYETSINSIRVKQLTDGNLQAVESDSAVPLSDFTFPTVFFMECDDLPAIKGPQNGLWSRFSVIPHIITFVDTVVSDKPLMHCKDTSIADKINSLSPYFAGILAYYYEYVYIKSGLKEAIIVTAATLNYREQNDPFLYFCQDCLVKETGTSVRYNYILMRYKEWSKYNPGKKILGKREILDKLKEHYGGALDEEGELLAGVRLAEEGEDVPLY